VREVEVLPRLRGLREATGPDVRTLRIGGWRFSLEGLEAHLAARLERRWGGFLSPAPCASPRASIRIVRGPKEGWLDPPARGERYRVDGRREGGRIVIVSYNFALWQEEEAGAWRCALAAQEQEPAERVLENAVRCLVSRVAVEEGGFALHAAGVVDEGRAYLFAGPSRAGKTTAVALSAPRTSLGDDFAIVLESPGGYSAPTVPFDNAEAAPDRPEFEAFPLSGIWRLFHAETARVERLDSARAAASLMACVAMPWTHPDLAEQLLRQVERFVGRSRFEHLHFRRAPDFWPLLKSGAPRST